VKGSKINTGSGFPRIIIPSILYESYAPWVGEYLKP
jgi:hypothetical protein